MRAILFIPWMTLLVVIACNVHNPVQQANQSIGTSDMIEYLKKL